MYYIQREQVARLAAAPHNPYNLASLGGTDDRYAMCNSSSFRPGEVEKLRENDRKLDDCRTRRKAAILRISRMVQDLG